MILWNSRRIFGSIYLYRRRFATMAPARTGRVACGWDGAVSDLTSCLEAHLVAPSSVGVYTTKAGGASNPTKILELAPLMRDLRTLIGSQLTLKVSKLEAALHAHANNMIDAKNPKWSALTTKDLEGPQSWQKITALRLKSMLRHTAKALAQPSPPRWVSHLFDFDRDDADRRKDDATEGPDSPPRQFFFGWDNRNQSAWRKAVSDRRAGCLGREFTTTFNNLDGGDDDGLIAAWGAETTVLDITVGEYKALAANRSANRSKGTTSEGFKLGDDGGMIVIKKSKNKGSTIYHVLKRCNDKKERQLFQHVVADKDLDENSDEAKSLRNSDMDKLQVLAQDFCGGKVLEEDLKKVRDQRFGKPVGNQRIGKEVGNGKRKVEASAGVEASKKLKSAGNADLGTEDGGDTQPSHVAEGDLDDDQSDNEGEGGTVSQTDDNDVGGQEDDSDGGSSFDNFDIEAVDLSAAFA